MTCKSYTFISWRVVLLLAIGAACYDESSFFPTPEWNENGSLTLKAPSKEVGKWAMYSIVSDGPFLKIGGERISESRQLIEPEFKDSSSEFIVYIYENGGKFGNNIAVNGDDYPQNFRCYYKSENSQRLGIYRPLLEPTLLIRNETFKTVATFANMNSRFGFFGKPMKIEIEIGDANLFGEKSHIESCKLDIYYMDRHVESIPILENSALTLEGRLIEFQSEYTPARGSERAKYTMNFKGFALKNGKPFYFNCQACSNCDEPVKIIEIHGLRTLDSSS